MQSFIKRHWKKQAGATAIEYALIAALIAVALVASLEGVQTALAGIFADIVTALS